MKSFKKFASNTQRLFKKAGGDVQRFFKKDGQATKIVNQIGGVAGSVGKALKQGANIGNQVLDAVAKSPLGLPLAPGIAVAKKALDLAKFGSSAAYGVKHSTKDLVSGGNAGQITNNILERAKRIKDENSGPQFV